MHDEQTLKWYDRMGKARPTHLPHGVSDTPENPLSEQLTKGKCWNWKLSGSILTCDTNHGPLSQNIGTTDYICHGDGPDGLPLLQKIGE